MPRFLGMCDRENVEKDNNNLPLSDAGWYFHKDSEKERFYNLFFQLCRKYGVRWSTATPEEKELNQRSF